MDDVKIKCCEVSFLGCPHIHEEACTTVINEWGQKEGSTGFEYLVLSTNKRCCYDLIEFNCCRQNRKNEEIKQGRTKSSFTLVLFFFILLDFETGYEIPKGILFARGRLKRRTLARKP